MAFEMKFDVYKLKIENDVVISTSKVATIWLPVKSRSNEENFVIASEHGGDMLSPTVETRLS